MGLSASQARLLSITARLSDNELKSQQISNSKVRLADKSQEASRNYIAALDASKVMYSTYDDQGNPTKVDLTAATLYSYSPYKSQYTLVNSSNQLLVSALDAQNFQETNSLQEFLARYDLVDNDATTKLEEDYNGASLTYSQSDKIYKAIEGLYNANSTDATAFETKVTEYFNGDGAELLKGATDATLKNKDAYIEGFKALVSYTSNLSDYNTNYNTYLDNLEKFNEAKRTYYTAQKKTGSDESEYIYESNPSGYLNAMGVNSRNDLDQYGKYFYDLAAYNSEMKTYNTNLAKYNAKLETYNMISSLYENNYHSKADFEAAYNTAFGEDTVFKNYEDSYGEEYKTYRDDLYDKFIAQIEKQQEEYNKLVDGASGKKFASLMGTSTKVNDPSGVGYCYAQALKGSSGCYKHLLAYLLDWDTTDTTSYKFTDGSTEKTYTTSAGNSFNISSSDRSGAGMRTGAVNNVDSFKSILESINSTNPTRVCDGIDDYGVTITDNDTKVTKVIKNNSLAGKKYEYVSLVDKLKSDYKWNSTANDYEVKTIKEKLIDTFYLLQIRSTDETSANYVSDADMKQILINLTEKDMTSAEVEMTAASAIETPPQNNVDDEPEFKGSYDESTLVKPNKNIGDAATKPAAPVEPPTYKERIIVNDQAKAQWYTNLWYRMNGSDTANIVTALNDGDVMGEESLFTKTQYYIYATSTNKGSKTYTTFDETLFKDSEWLQFALEQGIVSIQKAQYYDPSEDNGKVISASGEGIMWNRMTYSSCSEFVSVDDEVAIAKAEAEYNQALNEIQAQDKKLDNDLKKLDTEHNALQTEYESVKSVVDKNIERSFKAFS